MTKAARGEQTRDEILLTGARLFSLHGYFHTSTSDILEEVSISKGAFYHHFKSKQALALAILRAVRSDYEREVMELIRQTTPGERFHAMIRRIVELNLSGQWNNCLLISKLAQEMGQQDGELAEKVAETINWLMEFWVELIVEGKAGGTIDGRVNPRTLGEMIMTTFMGAIGCRELDERLVNLDNISDHIRLLVAPVSSAQ